MKRLALAALLVASVASSCKTTKGAEKQQPPECVCEDGCIEACSTEGADNTTYRTVERRGGQRVIEDSGEPFIPFDPTVADARLSGEGAEEALSAVGVGEGQHVFRGDFLRGGDDVDVVVVSSEGEVEVRQSDGDRHGRTSLGKVEEIAAVSLVDDRLELAITHVTDDGATHFTVLRSIGRALARVFTMELVDAAGARRARVEFVARGDERAIRVTPARGEPAVYRWNRWEGMFRIRTVPPTAPPVN